MDNALIDRSKPIVLKVGIDTHPRLDSFIATHTLLGRNQIKRYVKTGYVEVKRSGKHLDKLKPATKLIFNDKVTLSFPSKGKLPESDIIYQDTDIIAINKPAGILTHAKTASDDEWTAQDMVAKYIGDSPRNGLVHRLDRGTSGVLLFSRTARAHQSLANQFKEHRVTKNYLAIVDGKPKTAPLVMDWPIDRDFKKRASFSVKASGRHAVTKLLKIAYGKGSVGVLLQPVTGRTHQLRVHLKHLGTSIVGDSVYNRRSKAPRMMLHAYRVLVLSPSTNLPVEIIAPIPADLIKYSKIRQIELESLL